MKQFIFSLSFFLPFLVFSQSSIDSITPSSEAQGQALSVTISCTNVNLGGQWSPTDFRFSQLGGSSMFYGIPTGSSSSSLYGNLTISVNQPIGYYDLEVFDLGNLQWIQKDSAFEVLSSSSSWDCDGQGTCYDPGNSTGQYASLFQCQSNCVIPSWDCDGQGTCYDPGTGAGQYASLSQCQSNCVIPSWDCDGQGSCYDPGTGAGQYASLSQCQSNCVVPSWDCDGQGTCYDPGTGLGVYNTLIACENICINVAIQELELNHLKFYPNPFRDVFNIAFTSESIQDLRVRVLNVIGKELIVEDLQQFVGEYTKQINLNHNAKGIYLLEIETNKGIINKKLILQ